MSGSNLKKEDYSRDRTWVFLGMSWPCSNHNATATVSRYNQTQKPFKARKGLLLLSSDSIASINNWQLHRKERSYFILWGSSLFLKHHLISSFIKPWDPQKFASLLSFSFPLNVLLVVGKLNVLLKEAGLSRPCLYSSSRAHDLCFGIETSSNSITFDSISTWYQAVVL